MTWWKEMLPGARQLLGAAETGPALPGHVQPGWPWLGPWLLPGLLGCLQALSAIAAVLGRVQPLPMGSQGTRWGPGPCGWGEGLGSQACTSPLVRAGWGQRLQEGMIRL